ncbi:hypothetical protein V1520DRAFT_303008 [Lipomyces starkeyi]|uniref:DUF7729 domain-containing protein n=1 Tax=Lipomyces starkeyi NRRL Y-11557 TaxID=675824 RepID=A0A1E3Q764_LIPST|nr:hypothetical protein LIPSTDRAFT_71265 [Lipomyces starkeyi NRRL Y-11557]
MPLNGPSAASPRRACFGRRILLALLVLALIALVSAESEDHGTLLIDSSLRRGSSQALKKRGTSSSPSTSSTSNNNTIIPYAFDASLGQNFTEESCPEFFNTFLASESFIQCYPFSFFLQNSESFFQIVKQGAFKLSSAMDMICAVNGTQCTTLMDNYAKQLVASSNCAADYQLENPLVRQAYNAFTSYSMLYSSGCLQSTSGSYCYVDSVTNSTNPGDSYLYYLPLGVSLPGGTRPSCSSCSQNIMSIFLNYAGNASLAISQTYVPAAQQINVFCGPNFASTAVTRCDRHCERPRRGVGGRCCRVVRLPARFAITATAGNFQSTKSQHNMMI